MGRSIMTVKGWKAIVMGAYHLAEYARDYYFSRHGVCTGVSDEYLTGRYR